MIEWQLLPFKALSAKTFHDLIQLRMEVFVVEQDCVYQDLDGKDIINDVHQLMGFKDGELVACARLIPTGVSYDNVSIGRIATKHTVRGSGLGHQLINQALAHCELLWPRQTIDIGAQEYLEKFYQHYGFERISDMYLEDGIPHIDMRLTK